MTSKRATYAALLKWRKEKFFPSGATVGELADSISCEKLRDEDIPGWLRSAVTAFRHLRQDARRAAVRAFYGRPDSMWTKPRKRLRAKRLCEELMHNAKMSTGEHPICGLTKGHAGLHKYKHKVECTIEWGFEMKGPY